MNKIPNHTFWSYAIISALFQASRINRVNDWLADYFTTDERQTPVKIINTLTRFEEKTLKRCAKVHLRRLLLTHSFPHVTLARNLPNCIAVNVKSAISVTEQVSHEPNGRHFHHSRTRCLRYLRFWFISCYEINLVSDWFRNRMSEKRFCWHEPLTKHFVA